MIGGIGVSPANYGPLPASGIMFKRPCWIITNDCMNVNANRTSTNVYADIFEKVQVGQHITLYVTPSGNLSLAVGSTILDDILTGLPHHIYPIFDL